MKLTLTAPTLALALSIVSCYGPGKHTLTKSEDTPIVAPDPLPVDPTIRRILVVGAAGTVGSSVVNGLKDRYEVRGLDIKQMPGIEDAIVGSVLDFDTCLKATEGMDAVIYLVNIGTKRDWWEDLHDNMMGTRNIFEAARQSGVLRVAYSSETGVMGPLPIEVQRTVGLHTRPAAGYPMSKVFGEKLGYLYSSKYNIGFVSVRIGRIDPNGEAGSGSVEPLHPYDLSHADAVRVFERAVVHPGVKYEIVFGVSDSSWELLDLDHGRRVINYFPQDRSVLEPHDSVSAKKGP